MRVGHILDPHGHGTEGFCGGQHTRQRINSGSVKSAGHHDQVRLKRLQRRSDNAVHRGEIGVVASPSGQRHVDVVTGPGAFAPVGDMAAVQRIVAFLMQADRQRVGPVIEDRLGPVAVMHIPVQHGDLTQPVIGASGLNRNGDIGQQAEPVGIIRQTMVPGGARQGIGVVDLPAQHGVYSAHR